MFKSVSDLWQSAQLELKEQFLAQFRRTYAAPGISILQIGKNFVRKRLKSGKNSKLGPNFL